MLSSVHLLLSVLIENKGFPYGEFSILSVRTTISIEQKDATYAIAR